MHGGEGGRHLHDVAGEGRQRGADRLRVGARLGGLRHRTLGVVGRRLGAPADGEAVGLSPVGDEGHGLGRLAQRHGQHARRRGVQRAGMPRLGRVEEAPDAPGDLRRAGAGGLVDHDPAGDVLPAVGAHHTASVRQHRNAVSRSAPDRSRAGRLWRAARSGRPEPLRRARGVEPGRTVPIRVRLPWLSRLRDCPSRRRRASGTTKGSRGLICRRTNPARSRKVVAVGGAVAAVGSPGTRINGRIRQEPRGRARWPGGRRLRACGPSLDPADGAEDRPHGAAEVAPADLRRPEPRDRAVEVERVGQCRARRGRGARTRGTSPARPRWRARTVPSARTPTPLRMKRESLCGRKRGCSSPPMTSIGPDWVASRQAGRSAAKARDSTMRAVSPVEAQDAVGQEAEVARPLARDQGRELAAVDHGRGPQGSGRRGTCRRSWRRRARGRRARSAVSRRAKWPQGAPVSSAWKTWRSRGGDLADRVAAAPRRRAGRTAAARAPAAGSSAARSIARSISPGRPRGRGRGGPPRSRTGGG